jgi:predicted GNAT family N-acyltransferase
MNPQIRAFRPQHDPELWQQIRQIRTTVFLREQAIPPEDEWDEKDTAPTTWHLGAWLDSPQTCVGCARAYPDLAAPAPDGNLTPAWRIGRMAVLAQFRGQGIGIKLLENAMAIAPKNWPKNLPFPQRHLLSAQEYAIPFYKKLGFLPFGDSFLDAGIPHRWMEAPIPTR